jgi:hypothetical protein
MIIQSKRIFLFMLCLAVSPILSGAEEVSFPYGEQTVSQLNVNGQELEVTMNPKVVHSGVFATVHEIRKEGVFTSNYRYLGQETNVLKVRLENAWMKQGESKKDMGRLTISLYSETGVFILVPPAFQASPFHFQLEPKPGGVYALFKGGKKSEASQEAAVS